MAKSRERIIRDPSGPATVSRETLRQAAKKVWDGKREKIGTRAGDKRYTHRGDDGQFAHQVDAGHSHAADQTRDDRAGQFANAPALKPDRKK